MAKMGGIRRGRRLVDEAMLREHTKQRSDAASKARNAAAAKRSAIAAKKKKKKAEVEYDNLARQSPKARKKAKAKYASEGAFKDRRGKYTFQTKAMKGARSAHERANESKVEKQDRLSADYEKKTKKNEYEEGILPAFKAHLKGGGRRYGKRSAK